jgi:hypothetical protein
MWQLNDSPPAEAAATLSSSAAAVLVDAPEDADAVIMRHFFPTPPAAASYSTAVEVITFSPELLQDPFSMEKVFSLLVVSII